MSITSPVDHSGIVAGSPHSGTAEYVALSFKAAGDEWAFAWYVVALMLVALVSVVAMPDMQRAGHMRDR